MEEIKKYTFLERLKYTRKRNWFCRRRILGFDIPWIASDMAIHIDFIWRNIQQKNKKRSLKH